MSYIDGLSVCTLFRNGIFKGTSVPLTWTFHAVLKLLINVFEGADSKVNVSIFQQMKSDWPAFWLVLAYGGQIEGGCFF